MRRLPLRFRTASVFSTDTLPPPKKKTEEKERQQKKAKYANIKQRKVKACTKLSDNLYPVSSAEESHKLIEDFKTFWRSRSDDVHHYMESRCSWEN